MGSLVQRQPQQEVVRPERPRRAGLATAAALVAAAAGFLGGACDRDGSRAAQQRGDAVRPAAVPALAGQEGDLAAFLVPLHFEAEPARFANERLDGLAAAGRALVFFDLYLFDVRSADERGAPLRIETPTVTLVTAAGRVRSASLAAVLAREDVRSSVLPMLALETFEGSELHPGASIKALVAFDAPLALEQVGSGELMVGARVVPLARAPVDEQEFERLNGRPTREQVVAAAAKHAPPAMPAPPPRKGNR
jgi:hypothetical protein